MRHERAFTQATQRGKGVKYDAAGGTSDVVLCYICFCKYVIVKCCFCCFCNYGCG